MRFLLAVLLTFAAARASAEETAQFASIGVGARAIGMGGAYTALADDVSSLHWNPAGLGLMEKREFSLMYADLPSELRYNWAGFAQPTKYGTLGLAAVHLDQGSLAGRDASGRITGGFSASDSAIVMGYGRSWGGLGLGANVKYLRSAIGGETGQSAAVDLGGQYRLASWGPGRPRLGFAVQNLGPGMSLAGQNSSLPLTLSWGAGYVLPMGMTVALDVRHRPNADATEASLGTEYAILSNFFLRAGYASSHGPATGSAKVNDLSGFAAGFGVRVRSLSLDYSLTPYGGLGNSQRVSLGARW